MSRPPASVAAAGRTVLDALPVGVARTLRSWLGRPGPRPVRLDDLDAELARVAEAFATSEDEARSLLASFRLEPPAGRPDDPFSDGYRTWTWDLYRQISGRSAYTTDNEASPFDLERAVTRPFPFETGSATVVGGDLMARGHALRCIGEGTAGLVPPGRIVEFGPGWGNLTGDLVSTGFRVTAVEIDDQFCELIERRCAFPTLLTVVKEDMLTFTTQEPFDAAVFFESFHHCADHLAMLRNLHQIVRPGGAVFFASEPVQSMEYPWGPRLDGLSLWSTRTYGWLELGFDSDYFTSALSRTGWRAQRRQVANHPDEADVIVAFADPSWRP